MTLDSLKAELVCLFRFLFLDENCMNLRWTYFGLRPCWIKLKLCCASTFPFLCFGYHMRNARCGISCSGNLLLKGMPQKNSPPPHTHVACVASRSKHPSFAFCPSFLSLMSTQLTANSDEISKIGLICFDHQFQFLFLFDTPEANAWPPDQESSDTVIGLFLNIFNIVANVKWHRSVISHSGPIGRSLATNAWHLLQCDHGWNSELNQLESHISVEHWVARTSGMNSNS